MFDSSVEMMDTMASVASVDIVTLDADGLLDQLSKIGQLESGLAARKAEAMVAFHRVLSGTSADLGHESPRPGDRPAGPSERRWSGEVLRSVTDEIGLALGAHRRTAARWLNRAAVLVDRFQTTLQLLRAGGMPVAAAQHVAHELAVIVDDDLRAAVEKVVLAWGQRYGWRRIKKIAQREAQKVLAEYESLLHAQRQDERTTYTVSHDGGIAELVVSTSAIDVTAIMAALTLRARELQREGDPRDLNQLRTDLAVDRLLGNDQTTTGSPHPDTEPTADAKPSTDSEPTPRPDTTPSGDPTPDDEPACYDEAAPDDEPWWHGEATPDDEPTSHSETRPDGDPESYADTAPDAADRPDAETIPGATPSTETTPSSDTNLDAAGAGAGAGDDAARLSAPPESGLNPAVGIQVVIHCTYAEAEALATGAICTGGELEGYGPLPQDALAMAFTRAKFRYRLTDRTPTSDPDRYTPSPGLDQHVRDRDQQCRFPGCTAKVQSCDLDHRVPFPEGRTDVDNLGPFCRHHHRLKHHGDWQVYSTDTGTLVFISPTGRAYLEPPTMPDTDIGIRGVETRPNADAA